MKRDDIVEEESFEKLDDVCAYLIQVREHVNQILESCVTTLGRHVDIKDCHAKSIYTQSSLKMIIKLLEHEYEYLNDFVNLE